MPMLVYVWLCMSMLACGCLYLRAVVYVCGWLCVFAYVCMFLYCCACLRVFAPVCV